MISASQCVFECSQMDGSQEPPRPEDFEDWGEPEAEADALSRRPRAEPRCLLPDTKVLSARYGAIEASPGLQQGVELRSNKVVVTISRVEEHAPGPIQTVTVRYAGGGKHGSTTVTDSHRFMVKRGASHSWGPMAAKALRIGDELRGPGGEVVKVLGTTLQDDV